MRNTILVFALGFFILAAVLPASTSLPGRQPWDAQDGPAAASVVRTMTLVIQKIDDEGVVRAIDPRTEAVHRIQLAGEVPIKARSKKDFDGRKELTVADLAAGQKIKLTYRADSGQVLQIKVVKRA